MSIESLEKLAREQQLEKPDVQLFEDLDSVELPYVFDLLYDIKTLGDAYRVLKGAPSRSDATPNQIHELLVENNLQTPDWFVPEPEEQPVAWLDGNGGYITYEPTFSEKSSYTPVYAKPQHQLARHGLTNPTN